SRTAARGLGRRPGLAPSAPPSFPRSLASPRRGDSGRGHLCLHSVLHAVHVVPRPSEHSGAARVLAARAILVAVTYVAWANSRSGVDAASAEIGVFWLVLIRQRSTSATLQACAIQPRGSYGGSASKTSLMDPTQASSM